MTTKNIIPSILIEKRIFVIRDQKVMPDVDLADLYGISTKRLNEQVRRNLRRFPDDFMFELAEEEKLEVVAICDHLKNIKYSRVLPHAFTEYGVIMLANVLKSERAVLVSIQVVRAFARLREMLISNKELAKKLDALEKKFDDQFKVVFSAIRQLMTPSVPLTKKRPIGFRQ